MGAALLLVASSCSTAQRSEHRAPTLAVLGSDNVVTLLDDAADTVGRIALAPPPPSDARLQPGQHIALSPDGSIAYFLVPSVGGAVEVAAVDLNGGKLAWRAMLDQDAGEPRAILTAFGGLALLALTDRPVTPGLQGFRPRSRAMAFGLDIHGHLAGSWLLRSPSLAPSAGPEDWTILNAVENAEQSVVYVSFHNQGAYSYNTARQSLTPLCRADTCLPAHGQIALWNGGLLVATGSRYVDFITTVGVVERQFDTHLERNHLMSFAVDVRHSTLYAVGSCLYEPGLSRIDLVTGTLTVLAREGGLDAPCGETISVVGRVLALTGQDLTLVDARTGRTIHRLHLQAVSVVAVQGPRT